MGYIGKIPSAVPLTSADITDNVITSAKIVDSTIVNADIANSTINLTQKVTGSLPVANGGTGLTALGTASQLLRVNSGATALEFATVSGTTFGSALLHVRDEKASGTFGGNFTSGAWRTRTLNTVKTNEISGASLSSNQIILPSGTYYIHASAPAYATNYHKVKLANITDSTDTLIGTSEFAYDVNSIYNRSFVIGRFTIASQKTFELQHRCSMTSNFGESVNFSVIEVFADVQIWKVA